MIEFIAETGSTNGDLAGRLQAGVYVPEFQWLVTDRQIAGRGRQGRKWFDGSGNFMGSTVIHPGPGDPPAHSLALLASLALYETVLPVLPDPAALALKWPNDLLLKGCKLSGILLERVGNAVIVGIGVNLAAAPDLPNRTTISLKDVGPSPDRDVFAHALDKQWRRECERWRNFGMDAIQRRWLAVAHPVGARLTVHEPAGEAISGNFAGLAPDGSLRLRLADGQERAIHAGDVMLD